MVANLNFSMNSICSKDFEKEREMQAIFLIHLKPMAHFYTLGKYQKTSGFLMFPGSIEMEQLLKMSSNECKKL